MSRFFLLLENAVPIHELKLFIQFIPKCGKREIPQNEFAFAVCKMFAPNACAVICVKCVPIAREGRL